MSKLAEQLTAEQQDYLVWLIRDCGYRHVKLISHGKRWAAIMPLMYTHAIIIGRMFDYVSLEDRWCYSSLLRAHTALDMWNGTGEPEGWHRHPASGRRRTDGLAELEYVAP
jgi:hypothetical protein